MIELKGISKTFNKGTANENQLLNDFNLTIRKNEFTLIVGSNGSGKSTLLNLLAGTIIPDSGQILIDEKDISSVKDFRRSKWIARIFQDPLSGTAPELSILENFRLASIRTHSKLLFIGTDRKFKDQIREKIAELGLGLENKLDQSMGSLSGGQRQALTILMATSDDTRLLLLDEPVAALDPKTATTIMKLANEIIRKSNLTAIMVTHSMRDVMEYGDRLIMLKNGKIDRDLSGSDKKKVQLNDLYDWFGE
ncbi:MAG: ATP-binding cassette domain-containing protein [Bacteroidetes bacterium]|nr:ATP-binding cassette domain-containing protein [Bacteroidota bacterium]